MRISIPGIKVITFDGDGTLWDFDSAMRLALQDCLIFLQIRFKDAFKNWTVQDFIEIRDKIALSSQNQQHNLIEIRYRSFLESFRLLGIPNPESLAHEVNDLYLKSKDNYIKLYPEVPEVLSRLYGHFVLGVLSNGNTDIHTLGLSKWFNFTLYAEDIGFQKPNPKFYERVIQITDTPPQSILHIGDSIENDVLPAQSVGFHAVWVNRTLALNPDPDNLLEIHTLSDLLGYVRK